MPWGDRTGPMGQGPMTGRAAGYCAGYGVPGYANPVRGRGFGGRWGGGGRGRGWRHGYYMTGMPGWARFGMGYTGYPVAPPAAAPGVAVDEASALKEQAEYLQEALADVQRRLGELESESEG